MESRSLNLHITNFLRPFTLQAARSMIESFCKPSFFWMDSIKSQCYVTVATAEEADKLYEALNDLIWPEETGKKLKVSFVPSSALPKQGKFSR